MEFCCMPYEMETRCTLVEAGCCTLVVGDNRVELIALLVVLVGKVCAVEEVAMVEVALCCCMQGAMVVCGFVLGTDNCCTLVCGGDWELVDLDKAHVELVALLVVRVENTLVGGDLCALAVLVKGCCHALVSDASLDFVGLAAECVELVALLVVVVVKACVVEEGAISSTYTSSLRRPFFPVVLLQDDEMLLRLSAAWHAVIVAPKDTSLSDNGISVVMIEVSPLLV
eukprot:518586-Amphidinium_carterae.1